MLVAMPEAVDAVVEVPTFASIVEVADVFVVIPISSDSPEYWEVEVVADPAEVPEVVVLAFPPACVLVAASVLCVLAVIVETFVDPLAVEVAVAVELSVVVAVVCSVDASVTAVEVFEDAVAICDEVEALYPIFVVSSTVVEKLSASSSLSISSKLDGGGLTMVPMPEEIIDEDVDTVESMLVTSLSVEDPVISAVIMTPFTLPAPGSACAPALDFEFFGLLDPTPSMSPIPPPSSAPIVSNSVSQT